jgi:hypothetical protein
MVESSMLVVIEGYYCFLYLQKVAAATKLTPHVHKKERYSDFQFNNIIPTIHKYDFR